MEGGHYGGRRWRRVAARMALFGGFVRGCDKCFLKPKMEEGGGQDGSTWRVRSRV
jgi:hypothetical protein